MRPVPPSSAGPRGSLLRLSRAVGGARPPPPPLTATGQPPQPVYWQAQVDSCVFAGPLGEVVGTVEAGCVVREQRRCQDSFGGWWLGVTVAAELRAMEPAGDEAGEDRTAGRQDGEPLLVERSLAWLSYNGSHLLAFEDVGRAPPEWVPALAEPMVGEAVRSASAAADRRRSGPGGGGGVHRQPRPSTTSIEAGRRSSAGAATPVPQGDESASADAQQEAPVALVDTAAALARAQHAVSIAHLLDLSAGRVKGVPAECDLFSEYWATVGPASAERTAPASSWNQRYQTLLEDVLFHSSGVELESQRRCQVQLDALLDDFAATCQQIAVAVVERMLHGSRTTPGPSGGSSPALVPHSMYNHNVFYYDGLLVRLWCDTTDGFFGGETRAHKYVSRQFQVAKLLAQTAPRALLSVPLTALVEFEGYRISVSTIPPIDRSVGRVHAAVGDGEGDTPLYVQKLLSSLADTLNLRAPDGACGSPVSNAAGVATRLPVELEVYAGRDRRLYLLNAYRLGLANSVALGLAAPTALMLPPEPAVELVLSAFRPELCLSWPDGVNVNTGVDGWCSAADVRQSWAVSDYLKTSAITACAGMIGLHVPLPPALHQRKVGEQCAACAGTIDHEEVRFVVCRSAQRCCRVCAECYSKAVATVAITDDGVLGPSAPAAGAHVLRDCVKCWQSSDGARPLRGLLMQPSVTELMHACGLPLGHLGYVYHRLPRASRPFVAHFVETEMLARAAARLLRAALRGAATPADARRTVEEFVTPLVQSDGPRAERLWARELGPLLERMFPGIVEPFSTQNMSRELLLERVCALTGVTLSAGSLASLSRWEANGMGATGKNAESQPYIQLMAIHPRVKLARPPLISLDEASRGESSARRDVERLHGLLESALLFWIGYSPAGTDEALQPTYLESLFSAAGAS